MELDKFEEFLSQGNMAKNDFGISVCREGVWLSTQRVEQEKLVGLQDLLD